MKKSILSLLAVLLLLFTVTGCGADGANVQVPVYESDDEFEFMAYIPPPPANWDGYAKNPNFITDEQYAYMRDAGFTKAIALYEGLLVGGGSYEQVSARAEEHAMQALAMANKYGIKYYVRDWNFYGAVHKNQIPMEIMDQVFSHMFRADNPYLKEQAYFGNYGDDEPPATDYDNIEIQRQLYNKYVPDGEMLINLLPTYSSMAQRGNVTYEEYINQFAKKVNVDYIMYDHYPLLSAPDGSEIRSDYLYNLAIVARACKQYGKEHRGFVQSFAFGGGARDIVGTDDLRFQAYTNMAFGMTEIAYYTYFSSLETGVTSGPALISVDGKPTYRYDAAKTVNNEIKNFEKTFLNFSWDGIMLFDGADSYFNSGFGMLRDSGYDTASHARIGKVTTDQDLIMGTFKGKQNQEDGFMLVNNTDPYYQKTARAKVQFKDAKALLMYRFGQKMLVPLDSDGCYQFVLAPGEGRFIVPLK